MDVSDYIVSEVERQNSTQFTEFEAAMKYAKSVEVVQADLSMPTTYSDSHGTALQIFLMAIAGMVDPETNVYQPASLNNIRRSEVGFAHGGFASSAQDVQRHFNRWCGILMFEVQDFGGNIFEYFECWEEDYNLLDAYCKQLLEIHPWADGNGRTASIFRNWCLQTLEDPTPLPYYFGEKPQAEGV